MFQETLESPGTCCETLGDGMSFYLFMTEVQDSQVLRKSGNTSCPSQLIFIGYTTPKGSRRCLSY